MKFPAYASFLAAGTSLIFACAAAAAPPPPATGQFLTENIAGAATQPVESEEYRIGPLDKISVRVFGQADLTMEKIQVDANGNIVMPLIGQVRAADKTPNQLSIFIAEKLSANYQHPSVSVQVDESVSQRITVTGAVIESGIYTLKGKTTLLQAISLAKGPDNKIADLKQVAVFRMVDGRRARAVFDVTAIRSGRAEDPAIQGGDTVIVADSKRKGVWREIVGTLPALGIFAYF